MQRIVRKLTRFTKKEIDQLFKKARRVIQQDGLSILICPKQKEFGRILIIISRTVGNAPTRNTLRRRLKAIFYENKLYEKDGDWIILTKPESTQLNAQALTDLMMKASKSL